jgi:hypothetical protein
MAQVPILFGKMFKYRNKFNKFPFDAQAFYSGPKPIGSITPSQHFIVIAIDINSLLPPRPQTALNDRKLYWPRGKLLGGKPIFAGVNLKFS